MLTDALTTIPLTQNQVAIVDDGDYEWLSESKWFARWDSCTKSFYAVRTVKQRPRQGTLYIHRVVWEYHNGPIPTGSTVDHINRDTLDNQLSNLRLATHSQQQQNQGLRSTNTSGYRGVYWNKHNEKWMARITANGKRIYLGLYDDRIDAALAYDAAARIHFGEFAVLNFLTTRPDK